VRWFEADEMEIVCPVCTVASRSFVRVEACERDWADQQIYVADAHDQPSTSRSVE
jgi:hypothetical protein